MLWAVFAFLTAVCEAIKDGLCKRSLKEVDYLFVAWAWKTFSLIFLLPYIFYLSSEIFSHRFLIALVCGGILNISATLLYIKAIKLGDLSSTLPMLSFTPLFLLFTSPLMVGDVPDISGILGVCLMFLGSFILAKTLNSPSKGSSSVKGTFLMLMVAIIWSVAANVDKVGLKNSSLFVWAFSIQSFITLGLSAILIRKSGFKRIFEVSKKNFVYFLLIGLFTAIGLNCQFFAIMQGLVPYVISIKRLSIIFGVIIGGVFFKEAHLKTRLISSLLMFLGMLCLIL